MAKKSKLSKSPSARQRDYKAEYARRIARADAKGKTRQQARGHKVREHVIRREREIAKRGITRDQERIVINWYNKHYNPQGHDEVASLEDLLAWLPQHGYDAFKLFRATWDPIRRQYLQEIKAGTWQTRGWPYLQIAWDNSGVFATGEPISWLYYH